MLIASTCLVYGEPQTNLVFCSNPFPFLCMERSFYFRLDRTERNGNSKHHRFWWLLYIHEASCAHEHTAHNYTLCIWARSIGMYDGQKYTICDTCRPCHLNLRILKPLSCWIQQICCTYHTLVLWQIFVHDDNDKTNFCIPCAWVWGSLA